MVLSQLDTPVVQFWVEEMDLGNVGLGNPVDIVFDALPDLTYSGQIYKIDPVLVDVGNTPAVQCWATIDTSAHAVRLLGDMNVDVDIVAGQATNALLVPVEALRQFGEGQYAVFVLDANGELEMRPVEVGLQDFVNAVILSGVEEGEAVSLGEPTSSSSSAVDTEMQLPGAGMGLMFGGRP
jgi:multidrug efflux pump subunit AcrA (membrane-fusion protein)